MDDDVILTRISVHYNVHARLVIIVGRNGRLAEGVEHRHALCTSLCIAGAAPVASSLSVCSCTKTTLCLYYTHVGLKRNLRACPRPAQPLVPSRAELPCVCLVELPLSSTAVLADSVSGMGTVECWGPHWLLLSSYTIQFGLCCSEFAASSPFLDFDPVPVWLSSQSWAQFADSVLFADYSTPEHHWGSVCISYLRFGFIYYFGDHTPNRNERDTTRLYHCGLEWLDKKTNRSKRYPNVASANVSWKSNRTVTIGPGEIVAVSESTFVVFPALSNIFTNLIPVSLL